mgnify:FL=1
MTDIIEAMSLPVRQNDMSEWQDMVNKMKQLDDPLLIAVVGKYSDLPDSYLSVKEALNHAGLYHNRNIEIDWILSEDIEKYGPEKYLSSVSGIVVPGGFGPRGVEGMIEAARYAREKNIPYLGLCLGMQLMVIEMARSLLNAIDANSTEFDENTKNPVIDLMEDQRSIDNKGGTMRLGVYPCILVEGTKAGNAYNVGEVMERHRHRWEFNNSYRKQLEEKGLIASGLSPDGQLVEISEIRNHPFMLGVQFHPEFLSRPNHAHPLFRDFIGVCKDIIREGNQHPFPIYSKK